LDEWNEKSGKSDLLTKPYRDLNRLLKFRISYFEREVGYQPLTTQKSVGTVWMSVEDFMITKKLNYR